VTWEYATLSTAYKWHPKGDGWSVSSTVWLFQRGRCVAKWSQDPVANERIVDVGDTTRWHADEANPAEYVATAGSPLDLLGDQGWELVTHSIESTRVAATALDLVGYVGAGTFPLGVSLVLKRPRSGR
jgi:hypothetical protein